MTLVLSCISRSHVVQLSDRRLVWLTGPNAGKTKTDDSNKALIVCGRIAVAYTGLAEIANQKTDEWLLQVASNVNPYNPQRINEAIANLATEEFRKIKLEKPLKRHAFLVSGWARFNDRNAPLTSFVVAISNALDQRWHWLKEPKDTFNIQVIRLGKQPFLLAGVGQPVTPLVLHTLQRRVRAYAKRERGPEAYLELLATAIRNIAAKNDYVGSNLMAISLPRLGLNKGGGFVVPLAPPIPSDAPTAVYLPGVNTERILYQPNYTCGGMSMKDGWVRFE